MKKLLLIGLSFILLIVGCDNSIEAEDCAGVAGGSAVDDECGVCGGDVTNDFMVGTYTLTTSMWYNSPIVRVRVQIG